MDDVINILHLSDLHFGVETRPGWPKGKAAIDKERKAMADKIVSKLNDTPIDVLAITGDIAWSALKEEYDRAFDWLTKLSNRLGLAKEDVVICPGNHDIDFKLSRQLCDISSANEASNVLSVCEENLFTEVFSNYSEFCMKMGIPMYKYSGREVKHYLFGATHKKGLQFICLNSAWNCKPRDRDTDKGHLWLGRPQFDAMRDHDGVSSLEDTETSKIVISMFHHPQEWLANDEQYSYLPVPIKPTYNDVVNCSHVILNGHVHANASLPDTKKQRSLAYVGGTIYSSEGQSMSSFSVLSINKVEKTIEQTPFTFFSDELFRGDKNICNLFPNINFDSAEPSQLKLYVKEGVIRNAEDKERNIPLKVDTFNYIFDVIRYSNSSGLQLVFECGYKGGYRFGRDLNEIEIPDEEKITRWCEFDSAVGWGKFSHTISFSKDIGMITGELIITNCFQNNKNCDYVRGYCTGVLDGITGLNVKLTLCENDDVTKFKVETKVVSL